MQTCNGSRLSDGLYYTGKYIRYVCLIIIYHKDIELLYMYITVIHLKYAVMAP